MLETIKLKNYKAFEEATIPLKPITILLGANSVGKSSLIQMILMLQQTGKAGFKSYKSPLKLYGGYVNLGDSINLFRNKDESNSLKIGFELKSSLLGQYLKEDLLRSYVRRFFEIPLYMPIKGLQDLRAKDINNIENFELYLDTLIEILNKATKEEYKQQLKWILNKNSDFSIAKLDRSSKKYFLQTYSFLDATSKAIKNNTFEISFELKHKEKDLLVSHIELNHNNKTIIKLTTNEINELVVSSDFFKLNKLESDIILKYFDASNTVFNSFNEVDRSDNTDLTVLSSTIIRIFNIFQNELKKEFVEETVNYVSPLRAHPKRYYMLDKAKLNLTLDTLDGDAIAEVIKDDSKIKTKVNDWFEKFGIQINVEEFKEVIHHLKVKQNNLNLDITDVGFGISQVLPVIIQGFLSSDNSTTIIEQPEIHLHPKIQADLADLFIDIVKSTKDKKLLIETHSEYLLKRLRRRISEGIISANDVAICLVDPQTNNTGAIIKELKIENKGFFAWPIDFYGGELLKDTTEFIKNQQK